MSFSCLIIPDLVEVIFDAQINLPLFVGAIKQKLATEERRSVIIWLHTKKFSHRGIGMEMLVGMEWRDTIKASDWIEEPYDGPSRRASETCASRTTRRIRNAKAAPKPLPPPP